jgi:hypothetical protein
LREELKDTFICTACNHNAAVCDCKDPGQYTEEYLEAVKTPRIRRIIPFAEYIEEKYHNEYHRLHSKDCYARFAR